MKFKYLAHTHKHHDSTKIKEPRHRNVTKQHRHFTDEQITAENITLTRR